MIIAPDPNYLDDGRGRFPERITAGTPRGLRERVKQAAEAERTTLSGFVREAIEQRLSSSASNPPAGQAEAA